MRRGRGDSNGARIEARSGGAGPAPDARDPFLLLATDGENEFDARAIERQLRALWRGPEGASGPYYRAALANLVVPLEPGQLDRLAPVLVEVTRRHPARLFRIERSASALVPGRLSARASALCHLREERGGCVCSEEVILGWTEETAALVPSAVGSLAVGDLPVVFLAIDKGPRPSWRRTLEATADTVIVDSGIARSSEELPALWSRAAGNRGTLHDLAWARITPWRALLAEAFDAPGLAGRASDIREVVIRHGGSVPFAGAWLLSGWLAARLGWRFRARESDEGAERIRLEGPRGAVSVRLERVGGERRRRLRGVRLRASDPAPLDIRVEHGGDTPIARVERRAPPPTTSYEAAFPHRTLASAIVGELRRQGPNRAFEEAARLASAMIEAGS